MGCTNQKVTRNLNDKLIHQSSVNHLYGEIQKVLNNLKQIKF